MPKAAARTRRLGPGILLYGAAVAVAVGAFIQMRAAAVVVTCERDKGAALGCILDRRVLFNTVSIGRERVAGVRAARIDHRTGTSRRGRWGAFAVVLETAEGERDAGWSTGWNRDDDGDQPPHRVGSRPLRGVAAAALLRFAASALRPGREPGRPCLVPLALLRWRHGASA